MAIFLTEAPKLIIRCNNEFLLFRYDQFNFYHINWTVFGCKASNNNNALCDILDLRYIALECLFVKDGLGPSIWSYQFVKVVGLIQRHWDRFASSSSCCSRSCCWCCRWMTNDVSNLEASSNGGFKSRTWVALNHNLVLCCIIISFNYYKSICKRNCLWS